METDMCKRLEEAKLKEEARWKEKLMRKRPVWQTLAYSQEEDLAMRLQLRKDEERLRNEEHKHRMQLMYGRVRQQPTLFERQSKVVVILQLFCFLMTLCSLQVIQQRVCNCWRAYTRNWIIRRAKVRLVLEKNRLK